MPDRGKTIEDLKQLAEDDWILHFNDTDVKETAKAALALLKGQQSKQVLSVADSVGEMEIGYCPSCRRGITNKRSDPTKFCRYCGQAVKWDG